jgi:hypothetical protein
MSLQRLHKSTIVKMALDCSTSTRPHFALLTAETYTGTLVTVGCYQPMYNCSELLDASFSYTLTVECQLKPHCGNIKIGKIAGT